MKFNFNFPEQKYSVVLVLLFALFGAGLTAHILNLSYFLLLLIAIAKLVSRSDTGRSFYELYRQYKVLHWAMASLLLALILSQAGHGYVDPSPYNPIARLATFVLIFWTIQQLSIEKLSALRWSWIIGIIACAVQIYFNPKIGDRPEIENWYVALASLLGTFSVLSLAWDERPKKITMCVHFLAGVCGLYIVYVCQTRGVWLALPFFMLMGYLTFVSHPFSIKKVGVFLTGLIVSAVLFFNTDVAQVRLHQAAQDIQIYSVNKDADTSIGVRLQLWRASWIMIKEHPLLGVGAGNHYKEALREMVERKVLPTYYNGAHSHNEILYSTATMGILGFIAILLTYLVPGYYFGKNLIDQDRQVRAAAAMGCCVCFGFMIFGLADVLFKYKECEVFYCVSCATMFSFMMHKKEQLLPPRSPTTK